MTPKDDAPARALPLNQILAGDCIEVMNSLPEASVDLITQRLAAHEKAAWMLRSSLGER